MSPHRYTPAPPAPSSRLVDALVDVLLAIAIGGSLGACLAHWCS